MKQISRRNLLKFVPVLPFLGAATQIPSESKHKLRFIVASDGHYGQPNTPYEKFHQNLVDWVNQEKTSKGVDFMVINGDLIHDKPALLPEFKNAIKGLQMPYYVSRGNHDRVTHELWKSTWGYDTNHSFTVSDYAFIVLDTSNEEGKYLCPDNVFLKQELQKYADKKGIFVFMHITPAKWTDNGVDCPETRELFATTPNVKAIFHGHDHNEDEARTERGRPYFFDGHFGGSWGTTYRGYRVVEINEDGSWRSYQYNASGEPVINAFNGKA